MQQGIEQTRERLLIMEEADRISQGARETLADHIEKEVAPGPLLSHLDEMFLHGFAAGLRARHWEAFHGRDLPIELPNGHTTRVSIPEAPVDTTVLDPIRDRLKRWSLEGRIEPVDWHGGGI